MKIKTLNVVIGVVFTSFLSIQSAQSNDFMSEIDPSFRSQLVMMICGNVALGINRGYSNEAIYDFILADIYLAISRIPLYEKLSENTREQVLEYIVNNALEYAVKTECKR